MQQQYCPNALFTLLSLFLSIGAARDCYWLKTTTTTTTTTMTTESCVSVKDDESLSIRPLDHTQRERRGWPSIGIFVNLGVVPLTKWGKGTSLILQVTSDHSVQCIFNVQRKRGEEEEDETKQSISFSSTRTRKKNKGILLNPFRSYFPPFLPVCLWCVWCVFMEGSGHISLTPSFPAFPSFSTI